MHDLSLPGDPADDLGRGAPLSRGGRAFLRFAAGLGFHGLQLGPEGETAAYDPSPYNATLFSRSTVAIAFEALVGQGLVTDEELARAVSVRPPGALLRAAHAYADEASRNLLRAAWQRGRADRAVQERLGAFAGQHSSWLQRNELHAALAAHHREPDWQRWPEPDRSLFTAGGDARRTLELDAEEIAAFRFGQMLAHEQHDAFRAEAHRAGLLLFGDLQIGVSHRDVWSSGALLVPWLRMGAPPSRTNPEGQPWSYGVLHPDLYGTRSNPGPALLFLAARVGKLFAEFDGLRIDHPHGLIDPWVYAGYTTDPLRAVQHGARLFSSPERVELAPFAIARGDELDLSQAPQADGRVRTLDEAQVERYAVLFDSLVEEAKARGRGADDLIAEVLSTQPYPIRRVLERHGLGRFRVTQKASLTDPSDVYRPENARPQDWIMVGTHDTEPIWRVAERWASDGSALARASSLAARLVPDGTGRQRWIERVAASPAGLARAHLADLFVGPASNVMIFFADLLGLREIYNRPGTVGPQNWSLRVPPDFAEAHRQAAGAGRALDLPATLVAAMRGRGPSFTAAHRDLLRALDAVSGPAPDQV